MALQMEEDYPHSNAYYERRADAFFHAAKEGPLTVVKAWLDDKAVDDEQISDMLPEIIASKRYDVIKFLNVEQPYAFADYSVSQMLVLPEALENDEMVDLLLSKSNPEMLNNDAEFPRWARCLKKVDIEDPSGEVCEEGRARFVRMIEKLEAAGAKIENKNGQFRGDKKELLRQHVERNDLRATASAAMLDQLAAPRARARL